MLTDALTPGHDVLTTVGWIPIDKLHKSHYVCILENRETLNYIRPDKIFSEKYSGDIYNLESERVDLSITDTSFVYVKIDDGEYEDELASEIVNRNCLFKRDAKNIFTGSLPDIKPSLYNIIENDKTLPEWIWNLNRSDCFKCFWSLFHKMTYECTCCYSYEWRCETKYRSMADDLQRLCLHAGKISHTFNYKGKFVVTVVDDFESAKPEKNKCAFLDECKLSDIKTESITKYNGIVYNIKFPEEKLFMVRKNDKLVWVYSIL